MGAGPHSEPLPDPLSGHRRYRKLSDLGKGGFGFVLLAWDLEGNEKVAIKFINRGMKNYQYVEREILNHRMLRHPHVIQFKEVFLTEGYLGIVMEYAAGRTLAEHIHQSVYLTGHGLTEGQARWFFQQVILALDYCHRKGVVIRDVKPENTLLDARDCPVLKMCDFGLSKNEYTQSAPNSRVGTCMYAAPEVIQNKQGQTYDGKAADVWCSGVLLYVMMYGRGPFERVEDRLANPIKMHKAWLQRIRNTDYSFPEGKVEISLLCRDLIQRILVADPNQRYTVRQIMAHPWFSEGLPSREAYEQLMSMNDVALEEGPSMLQTEEDIKAIIADAARPANSFFGGRDIDILIDDAVRSEQYTEVTSAQSNPHSSASTPPLLSLPVAVSPLIAVVQATPLELLLDAVQELIRRELPVSDTMLRLSALCLRVLSHPGFAIWQPLMQELLQRHGWNVPCSCFGQLAVDLQALQHDLVVLKHHYCAMPPT